MVAIENYQMYSIRDYYYVSLCDDLLTAHLAVVSINIILYDMTSYQLLKMKIDRPSVEINKDMRIRHEP